MQDEALIDPNNGQRIPREMFFQSSVTKKNVYWAAYGTESLFSLVHLCFSCNLQTLWFKMEFNIYIDHQLHHVTITQQVAYGTVSNIVYLDLIAWLLQNDVQE